MPRILYCLKSPGKGGAELQLLMLAKELRDRHSVKPVFLFIGKSGKEELLPLIKAEDINYYHIDAIKSRRDIIRSIFFIMRLLVREKIEGIISFLDTPSMLSSIAHRFIPRVKFHIWGIRSSKISFKMNWLYSLAFKMSDYKVSNSVEGRNSFLSLNPSFNNLNFTVIPNGVNVLSTFVDKTFSSNKIRFCMVANTRPSKRYDVLIEFYRGIQSYLGEDRIELIVIGSGTKSLFKDIGVEFKNIKAIGHVDDVSNYLKNVDIGVLFTDFEGQPNVILEYMAHGLPVIASNLPIIRESLANENGGLLFGHNDIIESLGLICELMENTEDLRMIGRANFKKCQMKFSLETMAERYWALIENRIK